jgi:hypothetical protein
MSRENRRRAVLEGPRPAAPETREEEARPAGQRTVSWRHCLIGLLAGEALLLVLLNGSVILTNLFFGSAGLGNVTVDGGIVGVSSLLAVILGGFLAARLAGRWELYQGIVVAIGFIAVGALYQFVQEAYTVHLVLSSGARNPVDLGSMDMGGLMTNDLLALFGGSVGGLLGRRRTDSPRAAERSRPDRG